MVPAPTRKTPDDPAAGQPRVEAAEDEEDLGDLFAQLPAAIGYLVMGLLFLLLMLLLVRLVVPGPLQS